MHNILLIRHGQSEANVDNSIHTEKSDFAINLTDQGLVQAHKTGTFLKDWIVEQGYTKIHMINSSFERANQTANAICDAINIRFKGDFSSNHLAEERGVEPLGDRLARIVARQQNLPL